MLHSSAYIIYKIENYFNTDSVKSCENKCKKKTNVDSWIIFPNKVTN